MIDFATAETTRRGAAEGELAHANRTYSPVACGVHVCGGDLEENRAFTVLNVAARDDAHARSMWEAAKLECAVSKDEGEMVVDLCIAGDIVDDFWTNRQMLPRLHMVCCGAPA